MKLIDGLTSDDERAAQIFRALGNPARVRILREIAEREACITSDLVDVLPLAQSTVSGHLQVLREAGIIRGVIDGDPCYCLDPETLAWLQDYCGQLAGAACLTGCEPESSVIGLAAISLPRP
jgi:ArsR family transcriptional regulator